MCFRILLVSRLRELESQGVVERKPRADGGLGHEYLLTAAGNALRPVLRELGHWGLANTRDRLKRSDLDPTLFLWGLRRRADRAALPDRRIVVWCRQPVAAILGDHSLDTVPPADIRQKSTLEKSKVARSLHLSVVSPNDTSTPTDRREASACSSRTGNVRSLKIDSISRPTLPVAPTTAIR